MGGSGTNFQIEKSGVKRDSPSAVRAICRTPTSRRQGYSRREQYSTFASYVIAAAGALFGAVLLLFTTRHAEAIAGFQRG